MKLIEALIERLELVGLDVVAGGRTQTLYAEHTWAYPSYSESGHRYATLSDPFPSATTREEANAYVNRFNAPTSDGLWGNGNDPNLSHGWVAEPHTGVPIGGVQMDRGVNEDGNAWVRNTTDALHPFNGTVTRSVVESPEGFRVLTEGEGQGVGAIPLFGNTRNYINSEGALGGVIPSGPEIFTRLDDNMMSVVGKERSDNVDTQGHGADPSGTSDANDHGAEPGPPGHGSDTDAAHGASDPGGYEAPQEPTPDHDDGDGGHAYDDGSYFGSDFGDSNLGGGGFSGGDFGDSDFG